MSLRGRETTEAISQNIEDKEITTLPLVRRNDKKELRCSLLRGRIKVGLSIHLPYLDIR